MFKPQLDRATPSAPLRMRHASRWLIVWSVPLLLFSMLALSMQDWSVARAATPLQVGTCGTGTQDHATIQAAVNAAVSGTVINICPATYPESVNLSLMDSIGDITLRRVPGQTGDVLISAAISPSIWITYGLPFTGSITLESLKVKAATNHGIDFLSDGSIVNGSVLISNVVANENFLSGARMAVSYDATVTNSDFSENKGRGLNLRASGNINVLETQANNNGETDEPSGPGTGIEIFADTYLLCNVDAAATAYTVNVSGVTASENKGWGVYVDSFWDVQIDSTEVYSNSFDGVNVELFSCNEGSLHLTNSIAKYNGTAETTIDATVPGPKVNWGGFRLLSDGPIFVDGSTANENRGFGFCYISYSYFDASINIGNSVAENNGQEGFLYSEQCEYYGGRAAATVADTTETAGDELIVADVAMTSTLVITNSSAISNGSLGGFVFVDPFTEITLTNVSALRNINGVLFTGDMVGDLGFSVAIDSVVTGPPSHIDNSLIQTNIQGGVVYSQTAYNAKVDDQVEVTADFTSTHEVNNSIICENGAGLVAKQFEPTISAAPEKALLIDARGNWWGSTTGPTHPDNASGTGDSIEESALEFTAAANEVDVIFTPWINTIDDSIMPDTTLVGLPVDVEYQFRDGTSAYFLQNGVGDPNNGPLFNLSATNGTVAGDPDKFIVDSLITGVVTPTTTGTMSVVLTGPCGLTSTQEVFVATPGIAVEKSPDAQGIAAGDTAVFTVTVSNSGNITLTDITVADVVAPNCARATGALGDIGISASTSYTCSLANVTNNLVNTVSAEGYALLNGSAAGDVVSATDTANVYVASLTLTKTVFVDGYSELIGEDAFNPSECALNSNITVPVSSTVKYCYKVTNTGDYTVTTHSLVDSDFPNPIFSDLPQVLGPGESYSTVDAGVDVTKTLTVSVTNIATWTAEIADPLVDLGADAVNATLPVVATGQATVTISPDDLDQDNDNIPDNIEGTGDIDADGIPDFLDPAGPTNAPPTQQPGDQQNLFLPSLGNEE